MSSVPLAPPAQWPTDVGESYSPVRVVGKGGFASVWMAKKKSGGDDVAVKVMQDDGYAAREIAILSELTRKHPHPNIVRLIEDFRGRGHVAGGSKGSEVNCVVLSLARGPTLNFVLTKGGALGLVVARGVARQLVDAVAFLHGHAVIHRDIQPANIILSGSKIDDDLWWSDDLDVDGKVLGMAKQCRVTIVDFGFARALRPKDIKTDIGLKKMHDEKERPQGDEVGGVEEPLTVLERPVGNSIDAALDDPSRQGGAARGRGRSRERDNLNDSVSHKVVRELSALGTRNYAAPEITARIRNAAESLSDSIRRRPQRRTLGACSSDYGMDADAFSVGATVRHMVTGVPPGIDVEEFMASRNHPMKRMAKSLKKRIKKGSQKRSKRYRSGDDLPEEVNDLVQILTHYNSRKRATVRSVTGHPWIKSADASRKSSGGGKEKEAGGPIVYLDCAKDEK